MILIFLCYVPMLIYRDITPLNELKYLSIVKETLGAGHFITFSNHGVLYADKPPLYFWILMLVKILFGNFNIFIIGLFSLIPALLIIYIMYRWSSEVLEENEQITAGLMLGTTLLFTATALILRMDILMSLFITASLYHFYRIYSYKSIKNEEYLIYIYSFLAFFTKGPFGLLIPVLSIFLFLVREKKLSRIKEFAPLKGFLLIILLCGIWLLGVWLEGGNEYFYNLTVKQTVGRGINSFTHKQPFYYYFKEMWGIFFPWSFIYCFAFFISFKNKLENNTIERFFSSVIIAGFFILSVVSSKLELYILPLCPFLAFYAMMIIKKVKLKKIWKIGIIIPSLLMSLLFLVFLIFTEKGKIPFEKDYFLYFDFLILSISGIYSLYKIYKKELYKSIYSVAIGFLAFIFLLSFDLKDINNYIGVRNLANNGIKASEENSITNYYSYDFYQATNMDVYINKEIKNIYKLSKLKKEKNFVLFIKSKKVRSDKNLREYLKELNEIWSTDKYKIYVKK